MKNLLLTTALCIAATSLMQAQLFVRPNPATSTDSYVYAKDVQIYVEGEIELEKNADTNALTDTIQASIYLREDAQLFQGGSADLNTGDGFISVYQEGFGDAYDYNTWSSPVSEPTGTGNQNFGIARIHDSLGVTRSTAAVLTSALNGQSTPLRISSRWFYRYNPATQGYNFINNANNVPAGQAFIMKGTDVTTAGVPETQRQRYDFRGRANSGDVVVSLPGSTDLGGGDYDGGFNLIGNPYPSAIDLNVFYYDTANNGNDGDDTNNKFLQFLFYDEDRTINSHFHVNNKSGYGVWVPMGSQPDYTVGAYNPGMYTPATFMNFDNDGNPISSTGVTGEDFTNGRRMLPIGQGFFIQSIQPTNSTVTFKNSHRRYIKENDASYGVPLRQQEQTNNGKKSSNPGSFAATIGGGEITYPSDPQPYFAVSNLRFNTYFGNSHMRQMVLVLNDNVTDKLDAGWDGVSPLDGTSEAFFPVKAPWNDVDDYPLVINSVPFDNNHKQIPITLQIEAQMSVVITGIEEIDLPVDNVYVWDSLENTYQEITGGNAASFLLDAGEYVDRFYIVFLDAKRASQDTAEEKTQEVSKSVSFFQNNPATQLEVTNPDGYTIDSASIFDMRGRLVLTQSNLGDATRLTFPTGTFSNGIYLVILKTSDNNVINYKIQVEN